MAWHCSPSPTPSSAPPPGLQRGLATPALQQGRARQADTAVGNGAGLRVMLTPQQRCSAGHAAGHAPPRSTACAALRCCGGAPGGSLASQPMQGMRSRSQQLLQCAATHSWRWWMRRDSPAPAAAPLRRPPSCWRTRMCYASSGCAQPQACNSSVIVMPCHPFDCFGLLQAPLTTTLVKQVKQHV
jgi:hypothetical protein